MTAYRRGQRAGELLEHVWFFREASNVRQILLGEGIVCKLVSQWAESIRKKKSPEHARLVRLGWQRAVNASHLDPVARFGDVAQVGLE